ncbi:MULTISPECIES: cytochrome c oxidase accessory protein CcoG [unclassified Sphingomonas]|uniref:cytochrome c oxidase accessory protein CcoG n=1 Tax=unclassified Sphingomonas TaxID=196159 RepID=UPI0006F23E0A|nr:MULTISPECIES: cytochrome c oxidase accessory protein CcoG [unclassified Sphingomonas]KQX23276.1 cytochrome c oxidase accessory protein CcoG [Sphingomonas sp. Root1294]KQY68124.1 cytochrome c oxidase accessory protein CcoG [Sphingomonas sp. Root50]KRB91016.1 cytochrome c oxidase accessory protein CcoG [Sphingomonas sp. Root720]
MTIPPAGLPAKPRKLYASRADIFPRAIDGFYRRLKWLVMAATLAIYYVTPWLRWDRGPYAPDQAVLVDLAHRRFYFFAIEIWPHEFYYVAGLLVMAGIGLFLVTTTVGRAWCGYACPQTVWTDLFLHIERAIDGDRNAQLRLKRAPWTASKIGRRLLKHGSWLLVGLVTGGAWVFYFADAPTLLRDLVHGEAAYVAYATIAILTATTYVFGGFMREQVCLYMCPWPRIQGAMLDERSLIVTYKDWRGEPRSHGVKRSEDSGDCIDCQACVQVCPVGIDIRDGAQFACITCALCIDACDQMMDKVGRPRGLIDYATLEDCKAEAAGAAPVPVRRTLLRPRTLVYFSLWGAVGLSMMFALGARTRLDLVAAHDRNPLWVQLSTGDVRNAYTIKIRNMESRPRSLRLTMDGLEAGLMWDSLSDAGAASRSVALVVAPDQVEAHRIYVRAPAEGPPTQDFRLIIAAADGSKGRAAEQVRFDRPEKRP